jgi:hypothetical protein
MMVTKNNIPAKFPSHETTHDLTTVIQLIRLDRKAVVMNYLASISQLSRQFLPKLNAPLTMTFVVNRSAPLMTIITSPIGNNKAPNILISPGAFS